MPVHIADISTMAELHEYVHQVLCRKENLLAEMFFTQASTLIRAGEACGRQFQLQGPRSVRLSAVWAADQNAVYFYDTRGQRFRKERLSHRLSIEPVAA